MDGYKKLKPKHPGSIIRDPITKTPLSADGELKPWIGREGVYWRRRVMENSCEIVEVETKKAVEDTVIFDEEDKIVKKGGKNNGYKF